MNHPYPELTRDDEARRALFADWNAQIARSRREYRRHPFARCTHGGRCGRRTP